MTKRLKGRILAMAAAAMLPALACAQDAGSTQDVGTTTPPELRDFKLDPPPPPRTGPEPTIAPVSAPTVQPPPAVPTTEAAPQNEPQTAPRRTNAPAPRVETARSAPSTEATAPAASTASDPEAPAEEQPDVLPTAAPETTASDQTRAEPQSATTSSWFNGSLIKSIGGGAALLAALAAGLIFWRRRIPRRALHEADHHVPAEQPSPPARLDKPRPAQPAAAAEPEPAAASALTVQFKPTNAQLSIASLTVTGQLTVENRGKTEVSQLRLRSQMISAQDGQREAIAAFHANPGDGEVQPLGDMAAGERIDAIVEIRLPRTELHAFRWTEREFVAPIVLINVSGNLGDESVEARLSQLIGREGTQESPKMKPLAIDRGPKRYSGVAAHPVFA